MSSSEDRLKIHHEKLEAGKELRERVNQLKKAGHSNAEIADILGISESTVRTLRAPHEMIWYPGIYEGRTTDEWTAIASHLNFDELVGLVQKRAQEDGEWAIANHLVGENEDRMRRLMEFVSDEKNIRQCVDHIHKDGLDHECTVDWVCRELANASKFMIQ